MNRTIIFVLSLSLIANFVYGQMSKKISEQRSSLQVGSVVADDDSYLGQIAVYKFRMDTLEYQDDTRRLTAIGTEMTADLYSSRVGNNTYFKIVINGESFAVVSNPYGNRVSPNRYYHAWLRKDGKYVSAPSCSHMAGSFFLSLPYSQSDESTVSRTSSSSSAPPAQTKKSEPDWHSMGMVKAVSDIRVKRSGGEDDVVYEEESAILYSAFDGKSIKYKLVIARNGTEYDVYENGSYNGAKVQWDRHGKRVWRVPSLSEMYTHSAGSYYFNVDSAR